MTTQNVGVLRAICAHFGDFATYQRGDVISAAALEEASGYKQSDRAYALYLVQVCHALRLKRKELYPRVVTQRDGQQVIEVMTDAEAERYNKRSIEAHVRGIREDQRRRERRIDRKALTDAERRSAESYDRVLSSMVTNMRDTRRESYAALAAERRAAKRPKKESA